MKKFQNPSVEQLLDWHWKDFEPYYQDLLNEKLSASNVEEWLLGWSAVSNAASELFNRLEVATTVNTADENAEQRLKDFMENTFPQIEENEQQLKEAFLESGLSPAGFEIPLRNMRAEADLFRKENLPLMIKINELNINLDKIMGAQSVTWQGEEKTTRQMEVVFRDKDREQRRKGWELTRKRQLEDRQAINENWVKQFKLRQQIAKNAGKESFREYIWQDYKRFDYTPQDSLSFQDAIEKAVVPAVTRLAERRKKLLGIDTLRYYDIFVVLDDLPPLKPFSDVEELKEKASNIFHKIKPEFGGYFDIMRKEGLLDLANRKNKADGAYSTDYSMSKRPFVFGNAVGINDDVQTLVHEGGHAFHAFEAFKLPYAQQLWVPMEFNEVASMSLELLSTPFLTTDQGGFYSKRDAARDILALLEENIRFWPYMAIVAAFQHWAYENPEGGVDPDACDQQWAKLEKRFRPHLNWDGYEDIMMTGWHRKHHIHNSPFYYIEYGLAQLGAAQVWLNSRTDYKHAVEMYHNALKLGGTATLPELYETAGAKLAFDVETFAKVITELETYMQELEQDL